MNNDNKNTIYLQEITGQESGIVVYGNNNVIVCNWENECPNGGLPSAFLGEIVGMAEDEEHKVEVIDKKHVDDILSVLPGVITKNEDGEIEVSGMDILYDYNSTIPPLFGYKCGNADVETDDNGNLIPTSGTVYTISRGNDGDEVTVIAPDGWC